MVILLFDELHTIDELKDNNGTSNLVNLELNIDRGRAGIAYAG